VSWTGDVGSAGPNATYVRDVANGIVEVVVVGAVVVGGTVVGGVGVSITTVLGPGPVGLVVDSHATTPAMKRPMTSALRIKPPEARVKT
jgi:hypothetical protein